MKKLFYTLIFVVIGFTASYAQTAPGKYDKVVAAEVAKLDAIVKITEDQKPKLAALELDRQTRRGEMKALGENATDEQKASMKQWYKDYEAKVAAILTPEQFKTYKEAKAKEKAEAEAKKAAAKQ
ncbi:hypothetical protein CA265_11275 [Sphingobacteriaceae bacterium GW460-11-11-14-LB5]|nr:hypothetical protein CA265_11275 [Sphingobacteriaceae bacterium GW460-11-11-14-LB5]